MNDFSKISDKFVKRNEWIIYYALSDKPWLFRDDDFLQEARIWLCEAKLKYKKSKSSWRTFSSNYIKWAYSGNYNQKSNRKKNNPKVLGYTNVGIDAINENDLYILSTEKESLESLSEKSIFYKAVIDAINDARDKDIVYMHTLGYTFDEIGDKYNMTHSGAHWIFHREIDKIKKYLKEFK